MSKDSYPHQKLGLNGEARLPQTQNTNGGRKSQLSGLSGGMSNSGVGTAASGANGASLNPQNLGHNAREGGRPYRASQVAGTDKVKKNGRKLNSGIPAKILIGRSGQNVVI